MSYHIIVYIDTNFSVIFKLRADFFVRLATQFLTELINSQINFDRHLNIDVNSILKTVNNLL